MVKLLSVTWKSLKNFQVLGKRYYANGQENSMSETCQFLPNSSLNSLKFQSISQEEPSLKWYTGSNHHKGESRAC